MFNLSLIVCYFPMFIIYNPFWIAINIVTLQIEKYISLQFQLVCLYTVIVTQINMLSSNDIICFIRDIVSNSTHD